MITFNNIVKKFEEFCNDHFFIKTFSYGSPSDVDLEKFEQYPLLHLVYTGGDYNSPKAKTYNLEVYILSLPPSEADKVQYQKENISDAEQVAEDILADIQNGGNIFQFGYHYDLINALVLVGIFSLHRFVCHTTSEELGHLFSGFRFGYRHCVLGL
jgi:hypothetical protein